MPALAAQSTQSTYPNRKTSAATSTTAAPRPTHLMITSITRA